LCTRPLELKMSKLLPDKNLDDKSNEYDQIHITAQARTLAVLRQLDGEHKRTDLPFWSAVVATDSVSVNADYDNGTTLPPYGCRGWWSEGETCCLAGPARRSRRRRGD
jgi:hypothetical protein